MKKYKEKIIQKIKIRRAAKARLRRKRFLHLKHTGQLDQYYRQKRKEEVPVVKVKKIRKKIEMKSSLAPVKAKLSIWHRILNRILKHD